MKRITLAILTLLTIRTSFAQDFSTINFVCNKCKGQTSFTIYLNEQMAGSINAGENLEYKMYSEGRVSVAIIINSFRVTRSVDVKRGGSYYFEINNWNGRYEQVDEQKGKEYFASNTNTLKAEEDRRNPIVKSTTLEDDGPKQGSCFLIDKGGYLLTNYHVISGAKTVQVKGIGNDFSTLYGADVIAFDVDLDLALLKLKNPNLSFEEVPFKLSNVTSSQGTKSFVLGYPLTTAMGEEIKVTEGIISAKSGYKGSISQYQFSAAIQPGNSGSPLFDENGNVIGVINAKLQGAEGAGYAIKSQYVSTFLKLTDNVKIEDGASLTGALPLTEKVTKLKNFIFIVKTE